MKNKLPKNNKKNASSLLYITIFLTTFFIFAAFAVDGTIVLTNRVKLQNAVETSAMAAASALPYNAGASDISNTVDTAKNTFKYLQYGGLETIKLNDTTNFDVSVDPAGKKVTVTANMIAQPYFLAFFGVTGINLAAKAIAQNKELYVTSNYPNINWITSSASYLSDIISQDGEYNDTAILYPLGNSTSGSFESNKVYLNLINASDDKPLSLGPGGFITIKLPAPIVDKTGYDLYIKESGTAEGYMVFAGLDNNPDGTTDSSATTGPYVSHKKPGEGISWKNISCSGNPELSGNSDPLGNLSATYTISTKGLGVQNRFFGSGYFDLGASCIGSNISMVKYIRIVDDNDETGMVYNNSAYYKAKLYGEASTATAGADIDAVKVLNYVELVDK